MRCEYCGQELQPRRAHSPTAPNRHRFCSAVCRARAYRRAKVMAIEEELMRAQRAIERARELLQGGGEKRT